MDRIKSKYNTSGWASIICTEKSETQNGFDEFKNGQEVSFHVKEDVIAFWNDVVLNSETKDAAQEFSCELVEIQHNKSQPSGYSNYYTTKTTYLGSLISSQFLLNRYIKAFGRVH